MKHLLSALAAGILLTGAASHASAVPLPADDPFYASPSNLSALANGTIIRQRDATFGLSPVGIAASLTGAVGVSLGSLLPAMVQAKLTGFATYQVFYKSTDGSGNPVAEAATVLVPNSPWSGSGTRPVVSYQTAEDSVSLNCQPSYVLQTGLSAQGGGLLSGSQEAILALPALLKGYAIVYPDYEGPQSQWLAGRQAGQATLDGIRAALRSGHGLSPKTKVALWGYSGGGGATAWTAALAGSYAPDLNIVGAAIGSSANSDLTQVFNQINGSLLTGFLPTGIVGVTRADPTSGFFDYLTPAGQAIVDKAADPKKCLVQEIVSFATIGKMEQYTTDPSTRVVDLPPAKKVLQANSLVYQDLIPSIPVLNYHDAYDEVVPVAADNSLAAKWCRAGASVEIMRWSTPLSVDPTQLAIHAVGAVEGALPALDYISKRFAGATQRNDCPNVALWQGSPKASYLPGVAR